MKLFRSIIKRLGGQKHLQVTPEILGKTLVCQVTFHLQGLYELDEKENLGLIIDATKDLLIFQNTFNFYYSLFYLVVVSQIKSDVEMNMYGKLFLEEARMALTDAEMPKQYKRWALNDDSFSTAFDRDFIYYYHDQIQKKDLEDIRILMKILKCEKDNRLHYSTLKLQYRLCRLLNILPIGDSTEPIEDFESFLALWIHQVNSVIGFVEKVLGTLQPVMSSDTNN